MSSFDDRFVALHRAAFRVAFAVVGNRAEAEDIAQEALARALVRWRRVEPYADAWVGLAALRSSLGQEVGA